MKDLDGIWTTIAQFIEHFQVNTSTSIEKELITRGMLYLPKFRKNVKNAIASHSEAITLLVTLNNCETRVAKVNAA